MVLGGFGFFFFMVKGFRGFGFSFSWFRVLGGFGFLFSWSRVLGVFERGKGEMSSLLVEKQSSCTKSHCKEEEEEDSVDG
jgi:hypothetical protein